MSNNCDNLSVYKSISDYLYQIINKHIIDNNINIEVHNEYIPTDKTLGITILKNGNKPEEEKTITGNSTLSFKFLVTSRQEEFYKNSDKKISLPDYLDQLACLVEEKFNSGERPILDGFYAPKSVEAETSNSLVNKDGNTSIYNIDFNFKYNKERTKRR